MTFDGPNLCSQAWINYREGLVDVALSQFRQAWNVDRSSVAACFGLASVLLDYGDIAGARAAIAGLSPNYMRQPEILWLHARIAMAQGDAHAALITTNRLIDIPHLGDEPRAEALLLRGLASGALGQTGDAFRDAIVGKRIFRRLHAGQAAAREAEVNKLRRVTEWISWRAETSPLTSSHSPSDFSGTHIFLLGFPRSGTTLLEQVLAAHPQVDTLEEAPTLSAAYQAFLSDSAASTRLARLDSAEAEAWTEHYWRTVRKHRVTLAGRIFVDKQPAGTVNLPMIARLFPTAKILFALRDPRDVVLSCFRQAFQMNAMTYSFTDLTETAACYDACMRLADKARAHYPLAWLDARHEALVGDFDAELARILAFIGIEEHPAMRDFAQSANDRAIRTPSATQVRAGINRRGLGQWRHYERELAPVMPILAPWIDRFGYAR